MSTLSSLADDAHGAAGSTPGRSTRNLERIVGFEDVDGRGALAGERFAAERAAELEEDPPDLVAKITDFRWEGDGVNRGTA